MPAADRIDAFPRRWARERPDAVAIRDGARAVAWRGLVDAIDACARCLRSEGVQPGDRVLIVAENSLAQIASLFAASTLDAVAVPVNPRLSARELDAIRDHAQPRATLYAVGVAAEAVAAHTAVVHQVAWAWIVVSGMPRVDRVVVQTKA